MYIIYADEIFLENLVIDYILLVLTARLAGGRIKRLRSAGAASVGAVYSVLAAIPGKMILTCAPIKISVGVAMALIVFGGDKGFWKMCLIFFALSAGFAGAVMGASMLGGSRAVYGAVPLRVLILAFAVSYAAFALIFRNLAKHHIHEEITDLEIKNGAVTVKISALLDNGNTLRDPVSGGGVVICSPEAVKPIIGKNVYSIIRSTRDPVAAFQKITSTGEMMSFFLIPYSAVGTGSGMLIAFRPESILAGGIKVRGGAVAIAPEGIAEGNGYSALIGAA